MSSRRATPKVRLHAKRARILPPIPPHPPFPTSLLPLLPAPSSASSPLPSLSGAARDHARGEGASRSLLGLYGLVWACPKATPPKLIAPAGRGAGGRAARSRARAAEGTPRPAGCAARGASEKKKRGEGVGRRGRERRRSERRTTSTRRRRSTQSARRSEPREASGPGAEVRRLSARRAREGRGRRGEGRREFARGPPPLSLRFIALAFAFAPLSGRADASFERRARRTAHSARILHTKDIGTSEH